MQRVTRRFALAASLCAALLSGQAVTGQALSGQALSGQALSDQVFAQAPKAPGSTRTVNLTLEQRHVIRELVKELKVTTAKDDLKVAEGEAIPGKVELQPVPPLIGQKVPSIRSHRLYVTQRQILIVDPQDQRVVEVIE